MVRLYYHPWMDSQCIKTVSCICAQRVREITSQTDTQWKHVPGQHNPADIASRDMQCDKLSGSMWFKGPQFLKETNIVVLLNTQEDFAKALDLNDPELRKVKAMKTVATPSITERFKKFSTWEKLFSFGSSGPKLL